MGAIFARNITKLATNTFIFIYFCNYFVLEIKFFPMFGIWQCFTHHIINGFKTFFIHVALNTGSHFSDNAKCVISTDHFPEQKAGEYSSDNINSAYIKIDLDKIKTRSDYKTVFVSIFMHELGHSFGMQHQGKEGNLMSENTGTKFTNVDRIECERVNLCKRK